jgi:hypothetical protein
MDGAIMESRSIDRVRAVLGATINYHGGTRQVECQVRNISPDGAKIFVSQAHHLPLEFELVIPQRGKTYPCRTRWRRGDWTGVQFIEAREATQAPHSEAPSALENVLERLRRLEAETQRLGGLLQQQTPYDDVPPRSLDLTSDDHCAQVAAPAEILRDAKAAS